MFEKNLYDTISLKNGIGAHIYITKNINSEDKKIKVLLFRGGKIYRILI